MKPMVYDFAAQADYDVADVGGKAKTLMELYKVGFAVPKGIVLTSAFFAPWMDEISKTKAWSALSEEISVKNCNELKDICSALKFTRSQFSELNRSLDAVEDVSLFAVRSSSAEEDLMDSSYAGMYDSLLNVTPDKLPEAIANVFASAWDSRVLTYKKKQGVPVTEFTMAVIIQEQIVSEVSGVGFSLNPLNNCYDEAVINASPGLGEKLVSGLVTPDRYVVDKVEELIIEKQIRVKEVALSEKQVLEVLGLIKACEAHYRFPVDIEWTYDKGGLYLLQCRPITTYFPLFEEMMTKPGERKKLYVDMVGVSQGFDDPLSVLGLDIWSRVIENIGGQGIMPSDEGGYVINLHGKQYFNVSNILRGMGNRLGMATIVNHEPVLREKKYEFVKNYKTIEKTAAMKRAKKNMMKMVFPMMRLMIRMMLNPKKESRAYEELLTDFIKYIKALRNDKPFDELVDEVFARLNEVSAHSVAYVPGQLAIMRISRMFKHSNCKSDVDAIGMNLQSNPTARMGKAMFELACEKELAETEEASVFAKKTLERSYSEAFMEKYDKYMYLYGDRGFKEIDIATPRVRENPEYLFEQLKRINTEDSQMTRAQKKKDEAYNRLRMEAQRIGKLKRFNKSAEIYEQLFGYRETPKYMVVMMTGKLREIALEIGEDFAKAGRLHSAEDIFALHAGDIALAQSNTYMELIPLIKKNLEPYSKRKHITRWPTNIDSRGRIYKQMQKVEEGDLVGEAISAGVIQGRARVLHSPYEKTVEPGDILVTRTTEPAWTPVFINASGVVLEIGGILQHGAIIAREYGIPCVSGIREATSLIKNGDIIEVNGDAGTVRIIDKEA